MDGEVASEVSSDQLVKVFKDEDQNFGLDPVFRAGIAVSGSLG